MRLFESAREAPCFLLFALAGAILGMIYDLLYLLRRSKKVFVRRCADVIFLAAYALIGYTCARKGNHGALPFYCLLGLVTGFAAGRFGIGFFLKKLIDFSAKKCYDIGSDLKEKKWFRHLIR